MADKKARAKSKIALIVEVVSSVVLLITLVVCVSVMAQVMSNGYVTIFGYSLFRVETGSMEPTISTGALLVCKEREIADVELDDIICYRSKSKQMLGQVITHRVIKISTSDDGNLLLETRGDANTVSDGFYVTEDNLIGAVVWYSGQKNLLAGIMSFITGKMGFLGCIVIPVLLVSGLILRDSVKDIKQELNELLEQELQLKTPVKEEKEEIIEQTSLDSLTPEEYEALVAQLKAEILEELVQSAERHTDNAE